MSNKPSHFQKILHKCRLKTLDEIERKTTIIESNKKQEKAKEEKDERQQSEF